MQAHSLEDKWNFNKIRLLAFPLDKGEANLIKLIL